jgi:hypothetical protein
MHQISDGSSFGYVYGEERRGRGSHQAVAAVMRVAKPRRRFRELRALSMGVDMVDQLGVVVTCG